MKSRGPPSNPSRFEDEAVPVNSTWCSSGPLTCVAVPVTHTEKNSRNTRLLQALGAGEALSRVLQASVSIRLAWTPGKHQVLPLKDSMWCHTGSRRPPGWPWVTGPRGPAQKLTRASGKSRVETGTQSLISQQPAQGSFLRPKLGTPTIFLVPGNSFSRGLFCSSSPNLFDTRNWFCGRSFYPGRVAGGWFQGDSSTFR